MRTSCLRPLVVGLLLFVALGSIEATAAAQAATTPPPLEIVSIGRPLVNGAPMRYSPGKPFEYEIKVKNPGKNARRATVRVRQPVIGGWLPDGSKEVVIVGDRTATITVPGSGVSACARDEPVQVVVEDANVSIAEPRTALRKQSCSFTMRVDDPNANVSGSAWVMANQGKTWNTYWIPSGQVPKCGQRLSVSATLRQDAPPSTFDGGILTFGEEAGVFLPGDGVPGRPPKGFNFAALFDGSVFEYRFEMSLWKLGPREPRQPLPGYPRQVQAALDYFNRMSGRSGPGLPFPSAPAGQGYDLLSNPPTAAPSAMKVVVVPTCVPTVTMN